MSRDYSRTPSRTGRKTRKKSISNSLECMTQSFHIMLNENSKKLKMKLDGYKSAASKPCKWHCTFCSEEVEIIKFDKLSANPNTVLKKLGTIADYVDLELGNTPGKLKVEQQIIFIMWIPAERQVIGYLETEPIEESYKILAYFEGVITFHPKPINKPVIGISRLWTYCKYRRIGVAASLLDICRGNFVEGQTIPYTDLAFSSLTEDLISFLLSYCHGSVDDLLIYVPK